MVLESHIITVDL